MASAQVVRKQEHLEAGKRRLEEFRKKKAAAKKAVPTSQPPSTDSTTNEKQASDNGQSTFADSAGPAAYGRTDVVTGTSGFLDHVDKPHGFVHDSGSEVVPQANDNSVRKDSSSSDLLQMLPQRVGNGNDTSSLEYQPGPIYPQQTDYKIGKFETGIGEGRYGESGRAKASQDDNNSNFYSNSYGIDKDIISPVKLANSNVSSYYSASQGFSEGQVTSEPLSGSFNSDISSSFNGIYPKRSRPSFLDSLNIGRDSPASGRPFPEQEKSTASKLSSNDFVLSSMIQDFSTSSTPVEPLPTPAASKTTSDFFGNAFRGQTMFENSLDSKLDFTSQKQNEDFAALEQHIEDLTQEKFSLHRELEASKSLAESLASENSSLTESYNQQASMVGQLKAEMEKLQKEIKARLVELEAFKAEYTNAQLECNAADERAKLLASEVITLEEKALRLRSNELKLQREVENSHAEIASIKKRLSSLDKERRDLQQTIDALQEEKKLLQSKFRRASTSGISIDLNKGHSKKDAYTSTNDLGPDASGEDFKAAPSNTQMRDDADNILLLIQNRTTGFEDVAMSIPPDQVQMLQNISSLMSELMSEKEELTQALVKEVSESTKLKVLNKELSQKLEVQTQRLELLTAQSMASENIPVRQPIGSRNVRESVAYADEGDEVVERVLGWIMKLFPGGPTKRRTSRL